MSKGVKCRTNYEFKGASSEVDTVLMTDAMSRSPLITPMQDLPFGKGETLTIVNTSEDPNWWLASNAAGRQGMIPANYVVRADESLFSGCRVDTHSLNRKLSERYQPTLN